MVEREEDVGDTNVDEIDLDDRDGLVVFVPTRRTKPHVGRKFDQS